MASVWHVVCRTERVMERRTGFEIELSGLSVAEISRIVAKELDGEVVKDNRFVSRVPTGLGEFRIEIDASLLKEQRHREAILGLSEDWIERVEALLEGLAETVVPIEVVSPPLVDAEHARLLDLQRSLRRAGARGTDAALHYAFGLHLNPEPRSLDAETIGSTLRAFVLLEDALWARDGGSLMRKLTPFIDSYPGPYVRRVLARGYAPSLNELGEHYVRHNPTRNRALDLLPLLRHLECTPVTRDPRTAEGASRPTYHYRLPSCRIDDPEWSVLDPLNDWRAVERLAGDRDLLEALAERYRQMKIEPLVGCSDDEWLAVVAEAGVFA